jgi:transposase
VDFPRLRCQGHPLLRIEVSKSRKQKRTTKQMHADLLVLGYDGSYEMLFDTLAEAFRVLGGVPQWGIFDNMATAVDRIDRGKVR